MSLRLAVALFVFSGCVTTTGSGTVVREQLSCSSVKALEELAKALAAN